MRSEVKVEPLQREIGKLIIADDSLIIKLSVLCSIIHSFDGSSLPVPGTAALWPGLDLMASQIICLKAADLMGVSST